jgi:hypothetical protein
MIQNAHGIATNDRTGRRKRKQDTWASGYAKKLSRHRFSGLRQKSPEIDAKSVHSDWYRGQVPPRENAFYKHESERKQVCTSRRFICRGFAYERSISCAQVRQDLCQKADSTVRNYVQLQWHQVLYRCSPPSCTKSIKRCANPSYQNRLVKALDFGGVFRYTYLYEKVTPVEVSLRVLPLIS